MPTINNQGVRGPNYVADPALCSHVTWTGGANRLANQCHKPGTKAVLPTLTGAHELAPRTAEHPAYCPPHARQARDALNRPGAAT
jgi:hypothetical protein